MASYALLSLFLLHVSAGGSGPKCVWIQLSPADTVSLEFPYVGEKPKMRMYSEHEKGIKHALSNPHLARG